jgi:hypothetical protein
MVLPEFDYRVQLPAGGPDEYQLQRCKDSKLASMKLESCALSLPDGGVQLNLLAISNLDSEN